MIVDKVLGAVIVATRGSGVAVAAGRTPVVERSRVGSGGGIGEERGAAGDS